MPTKPVFWGEQHTLTGFITHLVGGYNCEKEHWVFKIWHRKSDLSSDGMRAQYVGSSL